MSGSTKPPVPEYRYNASAGRHELGVRIDGAFVPFATVDNARAAQLIENAANTGDKAADDDEGGE